VDLHPRVEDEDAPPRDAVIPLEVASADAPGVDQLALEVGQQLEGEAAKLLGKSSVRIDAVDADAEEADPELLE
jgi:hypothetical protein